ncbi:MAG TPA: hypothetical protein PLP42_03315 [Acidobacteriota bacterium]|nr:hypothetical protein [Acidobacteriota bacterium]
MRRRLLAVLFFLLVIAWFVFAFWQYLPQADWRVIRSIGQGFSARDSTLLDLLVILWFWLVSWIAGAEVLARLRLPRLPRHERFLFACGLGGSFWSFAALLLAASRLFYTEAAYGLMIAVTIAGLPRTARGLNSVRERLADRLLAWKPSVHALAVAGIFCFAAIVLTIYLLSALAPEIEFDARLVHLLTAKVYARAHGLEAIPDIPQSFFPRHMTMLYALGTLLKGETVAKLIQFLVGLLCLLVGYSLAARLCGPTFGWIAVGILVSSPLLLWEMRTAHLELALTLYISLALFAVVLWITGGSYRFAWLGACFLAFAQGTKYHGLWALLALPAALFVYRALTVKGLKGIVLDTLWFALIGVAGVLPWAIVNLVQTGNPVFPFLNDFFQSPYWTAALSEHGLYEMRNAGLNLSEEWPRMPLFLWEMVTDHSGRFRGNIGPFYLLLLPLLFFHRHWSAGSKIILLFVGLYSLIWLAAAQHARYFLPVLPSLAAALAAALFFWLQKLNRTHRVLPTLTVFVLFGLAVLNSPFFERLGTHSRYGSTSVMDTLPLAYLAGIETKDAYLSRFISNHEAVLYFNQLPVSPKKVVFWWTAPNFLAVENGGFGCYYSPFFPLLKSENPEYLRRVIDEYKITHFIVGQYQEDRAMATRPDGPFAKACLKRLFENDGVVLYEIVKTARHP